MAHNDAMIEKVRAFNRAVTQRVGALDDRYLARDRPLGEARVLWEIGEHGCDVRIMRARLELDSGYLSRLLRSLEAAGLITVRPSERDKRVRTARLTKKGRRERAVLERRSGALAWSMLEPLADAERERLVSAMVEVEKLLTVALIEIDTVDPTHHHAEHCLRAYFADLDADSIQGSTRPTAFPPIRTRCDFQPGSSSLRPCAGSPLGAAR